MPLSASLEAKGLSELRARLLRGERGVAPVLRTAMQQATEIGKREVARRAPGRIPSAVYGRVTGGGALLEGEVGVDLRAKPHALWVERGRRAVRIRPRRKKALRFVVGGAVIFSRSAFQPARRGVFFFARGKAAALPLQRRVFAKAADAFIRSR